MQRLQFVTYRDQTNGIIYLHENKRNERLMQKKTPITDPLYRSVQCLQPFLIARPTRLSPETVRMAISGESPSTSAKNPRPAGGPRPGIWCIIQRMAKSKCKQTKADFCFTFWTVHGTAESAMLWIFGWCNASGYHCLISNIKNILNTATIDKINKLTDTFLSHYWPFSLL